MKNEVMIKLDDGDIEYLKSFSNDKYVLDVCNSMHTTFFCEDIKCDECPLDTAHTLKIFIQSIINEATE